MADSTVDLIVQSLITAGIGFGSGGGLIAWVNAHRSRRAGVAADERQAKRDRISDLEAGYVRVLAERDAAERDRDQAEAQVRLAIDYVHRLRAAIVTGKPPPPESFPEGLTRI
ncbi:MAG: hypothetical protein ACYC1Z_03335 [Georgenia sp.]